MADLSITPANVVASANASRREALAGEAITAGQAIYLATATKKWMRADNNSGTAEARRATAIALNGGALNQPVSGLISGDVTIGATLTAGSAYYLGDAPGALCPAADLASGESVCLIGLAKSTSVLAVSIQYPGVTL